MSGPVVRGCVSDEGFGRSRVTGRKRADSSAVSDAESGSLPLVPGPADRPSASDAGPGWPGDVDYQRAIDPPGVPGRYLDAATAALGYYAATWQDMQQARKAAEQRQLDDALIKALSLVEARTAEHVKRTLRRHMLWPWLSQFPGLGGVHVARLVARIGDPRRFPGQRCSIGHYLPAGLPVGSPCSATDHEGGTCPGTMLPPRPGSGTRSLWHYTGLHADEGRSPRKQKGKRADWDPQARTAVLQPDGIADAIVRNRVPVYRERYDSEKARLNEREGVAVDTPTASDGDGGRDTSGGTEAPSVSEGPAGPARPFEIDRLARKIAAKAFVADLLAEWKRLAAVDRRHVVEDSDGRGEAAA